MTAPPARSPHPERRLLPAKVRAHSRVTALIEYGAQGQYVAVCPRLGVLSLVPDSSAWFDWLASVSDHDSVTHSVEIAPADRDGLVMAKPLFATIL